MPHLNRMFRVSQDKILPLSDIVSLFKYSMMFETVQMISETLLRELFTLASFGSKKLDEANCIFEKMLNTEVGWKAYLCYYKHLY